jgi:hypothetical protein
MLINILISRKLMIFQIKGTKISAADVFSERAHASTKDV